MEHQHPQGIHHRCTRGDATLVPEEELLADKCCTCHKDVTPENSLVIVRANGKTPSDVRRCKSCHNVRSALNRLSKNAGNLVSELLNEMDQDRLEAFYRNHGHLRGSELRSKVEETVADWKTSTTKFEFNATGEYLDEEDLTSKYASKPDILTNILKNAPRYFCPVKRTLLYADPKYTSKVQDATEHGTQTKRKGLLVLKDDAPQTKKNKAKTSKGQKDQEPSGTEQKIKAGERKKILKKLDAGNAKYLQLKDLVNRCPSSGSMIPQYVLDNANKTITFTEAVLASAKKCADEGKGDAEAVVKSLEEIVEQVGVAFARVKSQVDQAADFQS